MNGETWGIKHRPGRMNPMNPPDPPRKDRIHSVFVGDTVNGARVIERIAIATRPSIDPAAETHRTEVEIVDWELPFVVDLADGGWLYRDQIDKLAPTGPGRRDD